MKAVGVYPARKEVGLLTHPAPGRPAPNQVSVRTIEVGICGTDREICLFEYGTPPDNTDYLVLGHEAVGEVVEVGSAVAGLKPGDFVVPSVRRPCRHDTCRPCRADRQDFCFTGDFTERGIKMTHGFMTESFVEEEKHLYAIPKDLRDVAVLVEPLSVAEKALAQVWQVQSRLPWINGSPQRGNGRTAVVLGAGPIGILGTMALVVNGFKTYVYSRSAEPNPKADLVNSIGAKYVSALTTPVQQFAEMAGPIDLVYEALGIASITFDVLKILGLNGVFVFTGIPTHKPAIPVTADSLMRDMVLKNQVIVGTVNADRAAFENAIRDLGIFKKRWPKALNSVISGRFPIDAYRDLLLGKATGIKNVITIGS